MIRKEEIPEVLNEALVESFIAKYKDNFQGREKLAFKAMIMAYYFCILRHDSLYEEFLLENLVPMPDGLLRTLEENEGNEDAIDWASFNPKIKRRDSS